MKNYAIYLRKSRSDDLNETHETTLARHESMLIELAQKQNLNIVKIYREVLSGDTIDGRPEMQKLLRAVEDEMYAGVLVVDLDRLSRGSSIDQGIIIRTFQISNTKIITPSKTYDTNNENDEIFFELGLFLSRNEYRTIKRRLARGREAAVRAGKYLGTYAPYGYVKIKRGKDCTLEINPEQAEIVKLIFDLYTSSENRLGYNSIAVKLNNMGIPSMREKEWIASTVKTILKNPVYIGKLRWHYKKEVKKIIDGKVTATTITSDDGDYILSNGIHEPIIDTETWEKSQNYIKQQPSSPAPNSLGLKNPFAGLIICGKCGKKMVRKPYVNVGKPDALYCMTRNCDNKSTYFYQVEQEILNSLRIWLKDYKLNYISSEPLEKNSNSDMQVKQKQLKKYIKDKETFQKQLKRAYNLLEQGVYETDEFLERSAILKKNISDLEKNIKDIKNELNIEMSNDDSASIERAEYIIEAYEKIEDCAEKNRLLKEIISKVIYIREKRNYRDGINHKFEIKIFPKISK